MMRIALVADIPLLVTGFAAVTFKVMFVLSVQAVTWEPAVLGVHVVPPMSETAHVPAVHPVGGVITTVCVESHVADPLGTVTVSPQTVAELSAVCTSAAEADAAL